MGKKKNKGVSLSEQMELIDVAPENLAQIVPVAKEYRSIVRKRVKLTQEEVAVKAKLMELIDEADLQRLPDGQIKFSADGLVITVKPRDNLIRVREIEEEE